MYLVGVNSELRLIKKKLFYNCMDGVMCLCMCMCKMYTFSAIHMNTNYCSSFSFDYLFANTYINARNRLIEYPTNMAFL